MFIIHHGECDYCKFTWYDQKRYESCPNCGLTEITVWAERIRRRDLPEGRLSDIK